ncbi:single-stranded DNA-binding protein [Candidatus Gracilibacteria bacterium]|nr:single-stranded DNA-binding protein [Candidatus Gracilibacteria bacterium]
MRTVNKVILVGNLTRDPQSKITGNGQTITTFGIATNREWTTQSGERKESTEFHEIAVWGKLAEICQNFLKTGKLVYLEGRLNTRSWESDDGDKRFKTEIVLTDMVMLQKREASGDSSHYQSAQKDSAPAVSDEAPGMELEDGENLF